MVILLGSLLDPGAMLNRAEMALCQAADTRREKVREREKPYDVGHHSRGRPS
jgi:hypothetical protein